ncbi:hypothetical protein ACFOPN_07405 [Xanthomonas hyacinthi]|uniref:hypothetical protein n=1 Tax=Xanthomonas hyacinthi TaxID=56455 RepID=UPI00062D7FBE|nr:hypothetical protein [Xanthomonas hyacinthi]KLD74713.1 hypothetical protein Y886_31075 [Xanthomonas hyacinthi DSM 19077]
MVNYVFGLNCWPHSQVDFGAAIAFLSLMEAVRLQSQTWNPGMEAIPRPFDSDLKHALPWKMKVDLIYLIRMD